MSNQLTYRRIVTTRRRIAGSMEYETIQGTVELVVNVDQLFDSFSGLALKAKTGRSRQAKGAIVFKRVKR